MAGEIVAGLLAHSLALLSDAAHMLTDAGALTLSLVVLRLAARASGGYRTFGLRRSEILSAQANGAALLVLAGLIVYGAVRRLVSPPDAHGGWILVVALVGIAVNLVATWQLAGANRQSLNVEGSFQHVLTDLYAFIATAVAGGIILATGWVRADPVAALFVAALMLWAAWRLLRDSGRVLLDIAPAGLSVEEIGTAMAAHPQVVEVHDLHVWEVTAEFPTLSAHVLVEPGADCHEIRRELERLLHERFGLSNTTLGTLLAMINSSILLIALPNIFRGIGIDPLQPGNTSYLLWLLLGFLVVLAVLLVSLGRLGDMYGRVRMFNLGFAVFTFFSILLSITWLHGGAGALWLILMRVGQGVGGALVFANSSATLTDAFPHDERGLALGINSISMVAGSFLGLVLGGVLAPLEWRLVFVVSVPIGLAATIWTYH